MDNTPLRSSEWIFVGSFLLLFATIVLISQFRRDDALPPPPSHKKISVTVSGAVAKPGTFSILPGMTLRAVLRKSRPTPFANLRALDLEQRLEESMEIHLDELTEIAIRVEGAVLAPLELHLPAGTRISDLKSKITCSPDADRTFFRRRRLLRDGETLSIPHKSGTGTHTGTGTKT